MPEIKVSDATPCQLDWAVAKCVGQSFSYDRGQNPYTSDGNRVYFCPSTNWSHGGPIMERENIGFKYAGHDGNGPLYVAWKSFGLGPHKCESSRYGPTTLIAAMRCLVASKLGSEVEIPGELYA